MTEKLTYEIIREFNGHDDLVNALQNGSYDDKRHALLSISDSDTKGELAIDLFLSYLNDPDLKLTAYSCIDNFLETCRDFPLLKVLPVLIEGVNQDDNFIRSHCESALENLVSPGKITETELNFGSFNIPLQKSEVTDYLESLVADKIIIGLLYTFHHPHDDQEFLQLLTRELEKEMKSVQCVIGQMIDTKLWRIIEKVEELEDISLASYRKAVRLGVGGKSEWVYDRFDRIQEFAREQMKKLKPDAD